MSPETKTLLTVAITAMATLLGVFLTNRGNHSRLQLQFDSERKKDERKILRERIEELYFLTRKWVKSLHTLFLTITKAMDEKITYDQANDIFLKGAEKNSLQYDRIDLIIDLYFPQLKDEKEKIDIARRKANKIHFQFRDEYGVKGIGKKYIPDFISAQDEIAEAEKAFLARLVEISKYI